MSAPEEIVCASAVAFHAALGRAHGLYLYGNAVNPGDSVTLGGITVVYRPPPPRDEAREASEAYLRDHPKSAESWKQAMALVEFEKWCGRFVYPSDMRSDLYAAFLAGRASVKP